MSNGYEEQNAINNSSKNIEIIKQQFDELNNKVNTSQSSVNVGARVRTNDTIITSNKQEEIKRSNFNYYDVPTYYIGKNNMDNKAYAAVLIVMEVVSLIFLVSLITFVALKGLS